MERAGDSAELIARDGRALRQRIVDLAKKASAQNKSYLSGYLTKNLPELDAVIHDLEDIARQDRRSRHRR